MHRRRWALTASLIILGLTGCSSGAAGSAHSSPGAPASSLDRIGTPLNSSIPTSIRNLRFTTSDGKQVSLADLTGRIVVLSDVMTLCQETCPIDTATVVRTARAEKRSSGGKPPVFVSLTVDPARDTTTQLSAYRRLFTDPPPDWQAWTGSATNVAKLWNFFGVWRKRVADDPGPTPHNWRTGAPLTYDVQHSDEVFFIDASGRERFVLEGTPYATAGSIPSTLRRFMDADGRKNLDSPASTAWTETQAETVLRWLRH